MVYKRQALLEGLYETRNENARKSCDGIAIVMLVLCFVSIPVNNVGVRTTANICVVAAPAEQATGRRKEDSHGACYCMGPATGPPPETVTDAIAVENSQKNVYYTESGQEGESPNHFSHTSRCIVNGCEPSDSVGLMIPILGTAPPG
jgi:hypothetical protein